MSHPSVRAQAWAEMLRNDPVAAGQIGEHLAHDELAKLLNLSRENIKFIEHDTIDGALAKFEQDEVYDFALNYALADTGFWKLVFNKVKCMLYARCA